MIIREINGEFRIPYLISNAFSPSSSKVIATWLVLCLCFIEYSKAVINSLFPEKFGKKQERREPFEKSKVKSTFFDKEKETALILFSEEIILASLMGFKILLFFVSRRRLFLALLHSQSHLLSKGFSW